MQTTLKHLKPSEKATIIKLAGQGALRRRLCDMGLTPGTDILLRKMAPLGDPIEITVRGYELSLRKAEADLVIVEK